MNLTPINTFLFILQWHWSILNHYQQCMEIAEGLVPEIIILVHSTTSLLQDLNIRDLSATNYFYLRLDNFTRVFGIF